MWWQWTFQGSQKEATWLLQTKSSHMGSLVLGSTSWSNYKPHPYSYSLDHLSCEASHTMCYILTQFIYIYYIWKIDSGSSKAPEMSQLVCEISFKFKSRILSSKYGPGMDEAPGHDPSSTVIESTKMWWAHAFHGLLSVTTWGKIS